eukprot:GHRR01000588.1.p1 GENE.GHRR01000588.1~~GHRR01000588.1.p1  ORF type:complete len:326 (+),score=85.22 GHRR01000588.1:210-1187(+)
MANGIDAREPLVHSGNAAVAAEPFSPDRPLLPSKLEPPIPEPLVSGSSSRGVGTPAPPAAAVPHYALITADDIKWGSQVLDILEHPSVLMAGVAFVTIVALQDVSLGVGLIVTTVLMLLDFLTTLFWRVQQRLRHWPYALTHCLFWPLLTWTILTLFYQKAEYALWLNVFLWGSVAALMSMTVLYGYPFTRDLLKEKSPQGLWDTPWWTDMANSLANIWIILFAAMCALSLIPTLTSGSTGRQMSHVLNVMFNYLAPLFLAAIGLSATRTLQDKTRIRWLLAPGATATAGAGAAAIVPVAATVGADGSYVPLAGGNGVHIGSSAV